MRKVDVEHKNVRRWTLTKLIGFVMVCSLLLGSPNAQAEPLVKMENGKAQPSVIVKGEEKGKKIMLSVRDGEDAKEIAELINEEVDRVKAKVKGGKIQIKGKSMSDLLEALSSVEFGGDDDFGALADASNESDFDSGSSLRAKKVADVQKLFKDAKTVAIGKVVRVQKGAFPKSLVMVQILRGPKGALGKQIAKGAKINFEPMFSKSKKIVNWNDESNQINAGAWFIKRGDKVVVRIGKPIKGGFKAR